MDNSFRLLIELQRISSTLDAISFSLSAFFVVFLLLWCSHSFVIAFLTRMYLTQVSNNDFMRLLSTESNPLVVQFIFPFESTMKWYGFYCYWSFVKGHRFYTASREPLKFPESCELIQTLQDSKLTVFRNIFSRKSQQSSSVSNEEDDKK